MLGTGPADEQPSAINQVRQPLPPSRVVITAGKFSVADIFDNNAYAHDARMQFMNWSLMSPGAWDYPANTRGYTWGLVVEYIRPLFAVRVAGALMPKVANGRNMTDRIIAIAALSLSAGAPCDTLPTCSALK